MPSDSRPTAAGEGPRRRLQTFDDSIFGELFETKYDLAIQDIVKMHSNTTTTPALKISPG